MFPAAIAIIVAVLAGTAFVEVKDHSALLNPLTQQEVFQVGNALGTAEAVVYAYGALPRCPKGVTITLTNVCHDAGVLRELNADSKAANVAYGALRDYVQSTPAGATISVGGLLSTARSALATLQSAIAQYHLAKGA